MARLNTRTDHVGAQAKVFAKNRKKVLQSQDICGICGRPVDKSVRYPHPMSPTIDHIIPISKGGHPADINNLQLAHYACNRMKSDKVMDVVEQKKPTVYQSRDWLSF